MKAKTNLHIHSRYSDGTLWPDEIVARAKRAGLTDMALTDHDTMRGTEDFLTCCRDAGIRGVAAAEIDCVAPEIDYDIELLGYFPGGTYGATFTLCEERLAWREEHARKALRRSCELLGARAHFDELLAFKMASGRPAPEGARIALTKVDIYAFLRSRGRLPDNLSYGDFKNGAYCRVEGAGEKPHVRQVVQAIRADGGFPVLPHPGHMFGDDWLRMDSAQNELEDRLRFFFELGVYGVELYHYGRYREQINDLVSRLAARVGLETTFGSDCHGPGSRSDTIELFFGDRPPPWAMP